MLRAVWAMGGCGATDYALHVLFVLSPGSFTRALAGFSQLGCGRGGWGLRHRDQRIGRSRKWP